MSKLANSLATIKEAVTSYDNYQDDVIIIEFDKTSLFELKNFAPSIPTGFDAVILISISEGEMELQIDYVTYKAGKNSLILIMPAHITHFISGSSDMRGWVLAISKPFLETLSYSREQQHQPDVLSYMQFKKNPLTYFSDLEYKSLYPSLDYVRNRMRQHAHLFYKESIKVALKMFFLDLGNVYLSKSEHFTTPTLSRKEELFVDFLSLLRKNCKKQHDVKFYANELCITTQYLSSILKKESGKSAGRWIRDALMIEAKGMLKMPRTNVQQVANELHFPDQSTFGKFFKKHTGMSPMAFRKS
ncbi:MAG: helix-turn-helix transcriptional regulator [Tannerella sp.]|jgi:AraC-like DNA-binding protein|nr:helix-turn-helix transcriptional regulator [Tannerella sp.]